MAKIGIDVDGVLANFTQAFNEEAAKMFPDKVDVAHISQGWDDLGGLTIEDQSKVWDKIRETPNWWMRLQAYADNIVALGMFLRYQSGNDIWLVTSRTPTAGWSLPFQTDTWLKACGITPGSNYLGVITVDDWHNKKSIYKAAQFDFSIDDKMETVEACDGLANHRAYLLDRPWNQDAKVQRRVMSLDEFFKDVVRLKNEG